ncbi:MAG: hypothetical protein ACK5VI_09195 [Opitutia bacterium]
MAVVALVAPNLPVVPLEIPQTEPQAARCKAAVQAMRSTQVVRRATVVLGQPVVGVVAAVVADILVGVVAKALSSLGKEVAVVGQGICIQPL